MNDVTMVESLPVIYDHTDKFSCFSKLFTGTIQVTIIDAGTCEFPAHVVLKSSLGDRKYDHTLKGNETFIIKGFGGQEIVTITNWSCTTEVLSFHVKMVAEKKFFGKTKHCTMMDKDVRAARHSMQLEEEALREYDAALAAMEEMTV